MESEHAGTSDEDSSRRNEEGEAGGAANEFRGRVEVEAFSTLEEFKDAFGHSPALLKAELGARRLKVIPLRTVLDIANSPVVHSAVDGIPHYPMLSHAISCRSISHYPMLSQIGGTAIEQLDRLWACRGLDPADVDPRHRPKRRRRLEVQRQSSLCMGRGLAMTKPAWMQTDAAQPRNH